MPQILDVESPFTRYAEGRDILAPEHSVDGHATNAQIHGNLWNGQNFRLHVDTCDFCTLLHRSKLRPEVGASERGGKQSSRILTAATRIVSLSRLLKGWDTPQDRTTATRLWHELRGTVACRGAP